MWRLTTFVQTKYTVHNSSACVSFAKMNGNGQMRTENSCARNANGNGNNSLCTAEEIVKNDRTLRATYCAYTLYQANVLCAPTDSFVRSVVFCVRCETVGARHTRAQIFLRFCYFFYLLFAVCCFSAFFVRTRTRYESQVAVYHVNLDKDWLCCDRPTDANEGKNFIEIHRWIEIEYIYI